MTNQQVNEAVARRMGWRKMIWRAHGAKAHMIWKRGDTELPSVPDYCHSIPLSFEILLHARREIFSYRMKFLNAMRDAMRESMPNVCPEPFYWVIFNMNPMDVCLALLKVGK